MNNFKSTLLRLYLRKVAAKKSSSKSKKTSKKQPSSTTNISDSTLNSIHNLIDFYLHMPLPLNDADLNVVPGIYHQLVNEALPEDAKFWNNLSTADRLALLAYAHNIRMNLANAGMISDLRVPYGMGLGRPVPPGRGQGRQLNQLRLRSLFDSLISKFKRSKS